MFTEPASLFYSGLLQCRQCPYIRYNVFHPSFAAVGNPPPVQGIDVDSGFCLDPQAHGFETRVSKPYCGPQSSLEVLSVLPSRRTLPSEPQVLHRRNYRSLILFRDPGARPSHYRERTMEPIDCGVTIPASEELNSLVAALHRRDSTCHTQTCTKC